jgi:hypothetical protein
MKVTKWSIHFGELTVSEQQAEQTPADAEPKAGETSVSALDAQHEPVAVSVSEPVVESPAIAPDHEATPSGEPPKIEAAKPKPELPKGKLLIMSPGGRIFDEPLSAATSKARGKRRLSAMAAVVALAAVAGALGGALATSSMTDVGASTAPSANSALEAAVARIDADITALKAGLEQTSRAGVSQFNKTSDRLERIEKAQAEPAAKLAKLSEAMEKLRTAQQAAVAATVAAAAATPNDVTGSVTPPAGAAPLPAPTAPAPVAEAPKTEVARLPAVEGWRLTDVGYGGALIQNRRGTYEVYAGDFVPGLGRIDAIRKQDGHWVVVTSKGLIAAR